MADVTAPSVQPSVSPAEAVAAAPVATAAPAHDQQIGPSVSPPQPETPAQKTNQNGVSDDLRAKAIRMSQQAESERDPSEKIATAVAKKLKREFSEIKDMLHEVIEHLTSDEPTEEDKEFVADDDEEEDVAEDDEDEEEAQETDMDDVEPEVVQEPKRKSRRTGA